MEIMIKKRDGHFEPLSVEKTKRMIAFACLGLDSCDPLELELDAKLQFVDGMTTKEIQKTLVQTAIEKVISKKDDGFGNQVNKMNQDWQFVAARLFLFDLYKEAAITRRYKAFGYGNFPNLVHMLVEEKKYADFFVTEYTADELQELGDYIKPKRDYLFNYEGLKLLADRYLVKGFNKEIYELPQERFMAIAMHLALVEGENKVKYAKKFYDLMSQLKMTTATPTLANAGTPFHQLSSCFISGVDDNLWSIYDVNSKFSRVSKHGGALGIYLGKVRALNSDIRGFKNSSGGVIPWIRLYNDTAVAVDQLGKRKGGATVTLDIWHKDFYEFVELRTNNGDDRRKAHDIFPAISVPNIFMERMIDRENFTLFDPHEILAVKGYALEDFYDTDDNKEFTKRYLECEQDPNLHGIEVPALDMMKKIMRSAVETGTPFIFFRDTVNAANPNKHAGMIYASNLCHEIAQNVGFTNLAEEIINEVKELVAQGVKELQIIAQELTYYGVDLDGRRQVAELIEAIADVVLNHLHRFKVSVNPVRKVNQHRAVLLLLSATTTKSRGNHKPQHCIFKAGNHLRHVVPAVLTSRRTQNFGFLSIDIADSINIYTVIQRAIFVLGSPQRGTKNTGRTNVAIRAFQSVDEVGGVQTRVTFDGLPLGFLGINRL